MGGNGSKSPISGTAAAPVPLPKPQTSAKTTGIEFDKKEIKNSITYTVKVDGEEAGVINYSKLDTSLTPYEATVGEKNPRLFATLDQAQDYVRRELSK